MRNLRDIELKASYESGQNDLIRDFYVPVLENAVTYDRIAGFFSSTSLAIAAKGIAGLINNNGKMRIIACPDLSRQDADALTKAVITPEAYFDKYTTEMFTDIEDGFQRDHIKALGWMIANGLLEMRIAVVHNMDYVYDGMQIETSGIFHQKVGIVGDENGNSISFSGSINETANGWLNNIEEFKVYKSWELGEEKFYCSDACKFNEFWNNERNNVKVYTLPETVKNRIIKYSEGFNRSEFVIKKYLEVKNNAKHNLELFPYQVEAVNKWEKNGKSILIEMATGTGKTRVAIGCMQKLLDGSNKLIIIVSCPQGTLSLQWKKEVNKLLDIEEQYVIDGTNANWKNELHELILQVNIGMIDKAIVFTTHATGCKDQFEKTINMAKPDVKFLFVGDEVHGLGANKLRRGLLERYDYRVGLSATPGRWYDERGTLLIEEFFGNDKYEFTINDALTTMNPITKRPFLVPYTYKLEFVDLSEDELEEYGKLSDKVTKLSKLNEESDEYEELLELLLFKRANIVKNATNKYGVLEKIIKQTSDLSDTIIFVSPQQIDQVKSMLYESSIPYGLVTEDEGTKISKEYGGKTERQFIIDNFSKERLKVLVAIKCLDEGIDIPSAKQAILMSSSTNPREYIQRIGRVIRQAENKKQATIVDITVRPCYSKLGNNVLQQFEKEICEKEKKRVLEICKNAQNSSEALSLYYSEMEDQNGN